MNMSRIPGACRTHFSADPAPALNVRSSLAANFIEQAQLRQDSTPPQRNLSEVPLYHIVSK